MLPQLTGHVAVIATMMAMALAVQVQQGFNWVALAWQAVMGGLALAVLGTARRLRQTPATERASISMLRRQAIGSGICGVLWAAAVVLWAIHGQAELALLAVAVSVTFAMQAVAGGYLFPWAVVAFCVPQVASSAIVALSVLSSAVSWVAAVLIVLHGLVMLQLLRKNWGRWSRNIDLDVEKGRIAAMLQEQKEMAERAVQLKTRFLASASHDLRQPMHAISLYLDGLAAVDVPERIRAVISDARICAHDMNDMFRSLLDISRLDAQQAVPTLSVFSVGAVLARVEKEFAPLADLRGIQLKVRPTGAHVYSDAVMVERIAMNFVSNALRHTHTGRVLVGCRVRGRTLRLSVHDTGGGIAEADQQAIFDEFHRLDTSRPHDDTGGLGLGLAIVRRLAQALRLPLTVRSTPGRGSMFAVDLPLVHVSRARPEALVRNSRLSNRLVLLVDDESSILMATSFILQAAGCEVVSARSGDELLASLATVGRVPDAIICDFELNDGSNGVDVIRRTRDEFNVDLPALLVTGNTAGGSAEKSARDLGIGILYKPLEAAALTSVLEEMIDTAES